MSTVFAVEYDISTNPPGPLRKAYLEAKEAFEDAQHALICALGRKSDAELERLAGLKDGAWERRKQAHTAWLLSEEGE